MPRLGAGKKLLARASVAAGLLITLECHAVVEHYSCLELLTQIDASAGYAMKAFVIA